MGRVKAAIRCLAESQSLLSHSAEALCRSANELLVGRPSETDTAATSIEVLIAGLTHAANQIADMRAEFSAFRADMSADFAELRSIIQTFTLESTAAAERFQRLYYQ
jgi:hypothetical protein